MGDKNKFVWHIYISYLCIHKLPIMSTYTTEQIIKISKTMKRYLAEKEFSCGGGSYYKFQYKVVPIISRDKYNRHFHFKVVVTKLERNIMLRDDNGWVREQDGSIAREWRKISSSKLTSHRNNHVLRGEVRKLSLLKVFGLNWFDYNSNNFKVQWDV